MTAWHNDDPPRVEVVPQCRARGRQLRVIAAFDELLGRPVSMRALALLRVLAGPIVLLHLEPFLTRRPGRADLPRRVLRALRRLVPGAARGGLHRAALPGGRGRRRHVARPAHPAGDGDDVR